jgi:hypothetical protein
MAGVGAVLGSLSEGKWPLCSDGLMLQPLDALFLLFKNKGENATGFNVCFPGDHFQFPPLRNLLPDPSPSFTPDDFIDCLICLLISSAVVAAGMAVGKLLWEKTNSQFACINPAHKKWYVVANISKSFFLGCMCLTTRFWFGSYYAYIHDSMDMLNMKRCGMLYIATDLVALLIVPKLPFSTKMHHIVTTLLIVMVSAVNIEAKGFGGLLGVSKMAVLYGIFSTMPFLVNAYLALRVVYSEGKWLHVLVKMSLWPYMLCCACNWTVHLIWLCSLIYNWEISIINILYLLAISNMVNDDIVLMKWLVKRSSPGIGENKEQKKEK